MSRTRNGVLAVPVLVAVLVAGACTKSSASAKPTDDESSRTTLAPSTTSTTTTTAPPPIIEPLTGEQADGDTFRLLRPALAVKIDNSPEAMPQEGVNQADIVFEIRVEGISRLMTVYHSNDVDEIGPTRSARYSDPPILALLGRPLFGWSGANDGVLEDLDNSPWITNVHWDVLPKAYYRKSGRKAPHNLYTSTGALFDRAEPGQGPPLSVFEYLAPGEANTGASGLAGMSLHVGDTPSQWAWDAASGKWLRWQYGKRDVTADAGQVEATNVVILEIRYQGGRAMPTAKVEGSGKAIVMTAGTAVVGEWSRPNQLEKMRLTGADGRPMRLTPGTTFVALTDGATSAPLSPEAAMGLLGGK